jgi:hypothetical protein
MTENASGPQQLAITLEVEEVVFKGAEPSANEFDTSQIVDQVCSLLNISSEQAELIVNESERLYVNRMKKRFSALKVSERLKRTNPFLLRIRGAGTVKDWATLQVQSALYASEEEATGHLLEAIVKACFPKAVVPAYPDDLDFEVPGPPGEVHGYQVKMSWDCMPMSSRKNLSATFRALTQEYAAQGAQFVGFFAPCYGKAKTTKPEGQDYISLSSKEFWEQVGGGQQNFDARVGEVCALLCAKFRSEVLETLVPDLVDKLSAAAQKEIGDENGLIDYAKLFRRINR